VVWGMFTRRVFKCLSDKLKSLIGFSEPEVTKEEKKKEDFFSVGGGKVRLGLWKLQKVGEKAT